MTLHLKAARVITGGMTSVPSPLQFRPGVTFFIVHFPSISLDFLKSFFMGDTTATVVDTSTSANNLRVNEKKGGRPEQRPMPGTSNSVLQ